MFGHHHYKSPNGNLWRALVAELVGVALFQLLAGTTVNTPIFTGLTFAAIAYGIRYVSGGHLNPAISLAAAMSGHIDWGRGVFYPIAQILGALLGALLQVGLIPDAKLGEHDPGACVSPHSDLTRPQLWSWELFLTFTFLVVVYAAIFVRPGHGDVAPLAYGLALFAAASTGGYFTGGSPLNPAVTIASAIVFRCWRFSWVYLLGQLFAVPLAALWAVSLFGWGVHYPWAHETLRETLLPGTAEEGTSAAGIAGIGGRLGDSRADTFAPVGYGGRGRQGGAVVGAPSGPHAGSMM